MSTKRILVSLWVGLTAGGALALDLYVSPTGDDANPGTEARPLATLEAARDRVRSSSADGPRTVWLQDGRYERGSTFELLEQDGGTREAPVVYRATNPGQARICGSVGLPAGAWEKVTDARARERLPVEARDSVRQLDLKALGLTEYGEMMGRGFSQPVWPMEMELFFGDQRMTLARWPNYEEGGRYGKAQYGKVLEVGTKSRIGETDNRPGRFVFDHDRIDRWVGVEDVWLHGAWAYSTSGRPRLLIRPRPGCPC